MYISHENVDIYRFLTRLFYIFFLKSLKYFVDPGFALFQLRLPRHPVRHGPGLLLDTRLCLHTSQISGTLSLQYSVRRGSGLLLWMHGFETGTVGSPPPPQGPP